MGDLVTRAHLGDVDVVPALRDLVRGPREREDRPRDAAREVEEQPRRDPEPDEERDPDPGEQRRPAPAELRLRLRDHELAEGLAPERDGLGDRQEHPLVAGRRELDLHGTVRQRGETRPLEAEAAQARDLPREHGRSDVVEPGSSGRLQARRGKRRRRGALVDGLHRGALVERGQLPRLPPQVVDRLSLRVVLDEADRDRRRDDARDEHAREKQRREPEAKRPHPPPALDDQTGTGPGFAATL